VRAGDGINLTGWFQLSNRMVSAFVAHRCTQVPIEYVDISAA
jgi:hypothetical protein